MKHKKILILLTLLLVFALVVPASANDPVDDPETEKTASPYCMEDTEMVHPVANRIAERYNTEENPLTYETVIGWFCGGYGFGQIMLALQTSKVSSVTLSPDEILQLKDELGGWGQVWKSLDLKRKDLKPEKEKHKEKDKGDDPDDDDEDVTDDQEGKGPPPWANNDKNKGKDKEQP